MLWLTSVQLCVILNLATSFELKFPPWFKFGTATAAYQVEGAWNVSDKTESKWDRLTHKYPELIEDSANGDVACDSYHLWRRDIDMMKELGIDFYRFSISWPRLLPTGFPNIISEDGKRYYSNLIDGLLEKGIEPVVTLYHWDMPQRIQDKGGWTNPLISDWFADYARIVYSLFADRVKIWFTINEPIVECDWYHGPGVLSKGNGRDYGIASYLCNKFILLAHAKAWRIYDKEFKSKYHGKVSIANHYMWLMPYASQDEIITEIAREFLTGRYSHPIYSEDGGWPAIVEKVVMKASKFQGFNRSKLPPFTQEEIELVKGTYDFLGMNHYTTRLVRNPGPSEQISSALFGYIQELDVVLTSRANWTFGYSKWLGVNPEGLRQQLSWVRQQYGDIEVFISENGFSTGSGLYDQDRVAYISGYLEQVLLSIQDGVNVTSYTYWSLMDNLEWFDGYRSKFGLYEVDFGDINRPRIPRSSAHYFADIIKKRALTLYRNNRNYRQADENVPMTNATRQ